MEVGGIVTTRIPQIFFDHISATKINHNLPGNLSALFQINVSKLQRSSRLLRKAS